MSERYIYSKIYIARVILENEWGYHKEGLWYGTDAKNLARMVMDMMNSWYLPNKDQMSPEIVEFYESLAAATVEVEEGQPQPPAISFSDLEGEKFRGNGLRLEVVVNNNLYDMYDFVIAEIFDIFAKNGETPDDFEDFNEFADYLEKTYDVEENILAAIKNPNEVTIGNILHLIDIKYQYTRRHFRAQKLS